ncbi:MAG: hypothetical protein ABW321_25460, partial [Polyangiales bacterium]
TWIGFATARRLLQAPGVPRKVAARAGWLAGLGALLFGVHPMAAEVVLYTSQRTESLVALWYLATLWLLTREAGEGARCWPWVLCASALGVVSKEVYVTAPWVVWCCDRAFYAGSFRAALTRRGRFYAALCLPLVLIPVLQLGDPRQDSTRFFELDYLVAQARIVPGYLLTALWPARPALDYGQLWPQDASGAAGWIAVSVLLAAVSGIAGWCWPRRGFVGVWVCAILVPTSSLVSIHTEVGADRRFYLPLLGVMVALVVAVHVGGSALERAAADGGRLVARWSSGVILAAAVLLALHTRQHAASFASVRAFWQAAVAARPDCARAHYNLAETLRREADLPGALMSFARAADLQPRYADAHVNLAGLLITRGSLREGLRHAERGAALAPSSPNAHYNLALARALNGLRDPALSELETTVRLQPAHLEARRKLAQAYLHVGQIQAARAQALTLQAYLPTDPTAARILAAQ